jgi:hypothetical protein
VKKFFFQEFFQKIFSKKKIAKKTEIFQKNRKNMINIMKTMKPTSVLPIRTVHVASTIFGKFEAAIQHIHPSSSAVRPELIFFPKFSKAYSDFFDFLFLF